MTKVSSRSKKPLALQPNDTIALIAPASPPLHPSAIEAATKLLEERGFQVVLGKSVHQRKGFIAGTDAQRAGDLNAAIKNKKVRAIFCMRGGYGCGRILSKINYRDLKENPKIVVGCSDITCLHSAISKFSNIVSFHGPMPQSLIDPSCPKFTTDALFRLLSGSEDSLGSICTGYEHRTETVYSFRKGRVSAPLVGGNLSVLCSLIGTPFFPKLDNKILIIEEIGDMPFRIDRSLTQLINAGLLDGVAGFALGLFKDCEYRPQGPNDFIEKKQLLREVFEERLGQFRKPIVVGLPFGHKPHNCTLPIGAVATLDGTKADLILEETAVS